MKTAAAVVAGVLALAAPAWAQDAQGDPSEGMARMLQRTLNLSEEQVTKVKEIFKKQSAEIQGVLNDEQKQRYNDMNRAFGGGGNRGGPGGGFGRGGTGGYMPSTEELKTQLSLSADQVTRIDEFRDATRQAVRGFWQSQQGGGNPADAWTAFQQKQRDELTKKVRDVLTDEQKPKFDEVMKTFASQQPPQGGGPGGGRGGRSTEDRVARVMEALKVEDAKESDAIKGLVTKVVELMAKLDSQQREARGKIDETARNRELSDEAVGDKIGELTKGLRETEKELAAARKDLADVVTNRQELELMRQGIIR